MNKPSLPAAFVMTSVAQTSAPSVDFHAWLSAELASAAAYAGSLKAGEVVSFRSVAQGLISAAAKESTLRPCMVIQGSLS